MCCVCDGQQLASKSVRELSHVDHLMHERFPWLLPRLVCHLYKAYSAGAWGSALSLSRGFVENRRVYVYVLMLCVIVRWMIRKSV